MDPFVGEIRLLPYVFAPIDWLACDGSLYDTRQYPGLFAIIGNRFGGSAAQKTFAVPDLREQAVMSMGQAPGGLISRQFGKQYGESNVSLNVLHIPGHTHTLQRKAQTTGVNGYTQKTAAASHTSSLGNAATSAAPLKTSTNGTLNTNLSPNSVSSFGTNNVTAHSNMQPYLAMQYAIAAIGVFPESP